MRTLPSITLAEMDSIGLMNRIDTKYVTHENILVELLREAALRGYRVLETSAGKSNPSILTPNRLKCTGCTCTGNLCGRKSARACM